MLLFRTIDFLGERPTGTHTTRCSRYDLFAIAGSLPPLARWKDAIFDDAKSKIRAEFGLSGNEFCKALNVIKSHRELRAALGDEPPLQYLTDELVIKAIQVWRTWYPKQAKSTPPMVMRGSDISIDTVTDANKKDVAITAAIIYPAQQFGELAAIHFLARDHYFSEYFPQHVAAETAGYLAKKEARPNKSFICSKKRTFYYTFHMAPFRLAV